MSTEVEELSLFDLNSFTAASDYKVDTEGYDPSWDILEKSLEATPPTVSISPSETLSFATATVAQPPQSVQQSNFQELADQVREFDLQVVAVSLGWIKISMIVTSGKMLNTLSVSVVVSLWTE